MSENPEQNPQQPPSPPQPPPLENREPEHREPENRDRNGNGTSNKRIFGAWFLLALLFLFMVGLWFRSPEEELPQLSPLDFRTYVTNRVIEKVEMVRQSDGETFLRGTQKGKPGEAPKKFRVNVFPSEGLEQFLIEQKVPCPLVYQNNWFSQLVPQLVGILLITLLFFFFFVRSIRSVNGNAMRFGKSRAKLLNQDNRKVTFADVGGVQEAKEEVQEIVEFLKAPEKFQKLGGKIPKGVLLMGPPGTGKTLLAKAIAGEAGVPFFSISGSDFVEMFVGVGASRVRDMFEQGKKHAPCLIFIDEIDAVGRSRFSGIGGGHDEREQTLNAMLVEMDGFDTNEGVIIIAATNRPDVLDPALLRPGRFDRQIVIDLPSLAGREEILGMHAAKITLGSDCDLSRVARGTPGFSGEDLANLLNEAALIAARKNAAAVCHADLEEARDKVIWGRERRSRKLDARDMEITAWHESGHALLQVFLPHAHPLHKVTIIPRGRALGATMALPEKDVLNETKSELLDEIAVMTGGRIAEAFFTGDISTGARQDIKMASETARKMVCAYGMSDIFGFQSFGDNQETVFIGKEYTRSQAYSEDTAKKIDAECERIVNEQYARAQKLLEENRDKLELLVHHLLIEETIDGRDVEELLKTGSFSKVSTPPPPDPSGTPPAADTADGIPHTPETDNGAKA